MFKKNKNQKGSMLLGVLIVMLVIASIAIAIVRRTQEGAKIVTTSQKSYEAYQTADLNTEKVLQNIKMLDEDTTGYIPENVVASNAGFCSGNVKCYETQQQIENQTDINSNNSKRVKDIIYVSDSGQQIGTERAVAAPVQGRVNNPLAYLRISSCWGTGPSNSDDPCNQAVDSDDYIKRCCKEGNMDGDVIYNYCYSKATWDFQDGADFSNVSGLEMRVSKNNAYLNDVSSRWRSPVLPTSGPVVVSESNAVPEVDMATKKWLIFDNSEVGGGNQYGSTYYFTMKAKNKNNLSLDSLYFRPTTGSFQLGDDQAFDMSGMGDFVPGPSTWPWTASENLLYNLGCVDDTLASTMSGIRLAQSFNVCCNNREAYESVGGAWESDGDKDCSRQLCGQNNYDEVELFSGSGSSTTCQTTSDCTAKGNTAASPTSGSGFCGTIQNCQKASDAECEPGTANYYPYRRIGYCTSCPAASTQDSGFIPTSTNWQFSGYMDIDLNTSRTNNQPRCCQHVRPGQPANSVCQSQVARVGYSTMNGDNTVATGDKWIINSFSSTTNACGYYNASFNCGIQCKADYVPDRGGTVNAGPENKITVNYDGTCCREDCSNNTPTNCTAAGYECSDTITWSPTTCGACTNNISTVCHNKYGSMPSDCCAGYQSCSGWVCTLAKPANCSTCDASGCTACNPHYYVNASKTCSVCACGECGKDACGFSGYCGSCPSSYNCVE